jgi:flagellar protein FlbD
MIRVTRLNNQPFLINSDLIKFVEQAPDTLITLVSGEKLIVREKPEDIVDQIIHFRRSVLSGLNSSGSDPNLLATLLRKHPESEGNMGSLEEGTDRG